MHNHALKWDGRYRARLLALRYIQKRDPMLYKLDSSSGKFDKLEAVAFKDFSSFGKLEKDLEELVAKSILDVGCFCPNRQIGLFQNLTT